MSAVFGAKKIELNQAIKKIESLGVWEKGERGVPTPPPTDEGRGGLDPPPRRGGVGLEPPPLYQSRPKTPFLDVPALRRTALQSIFIRYFFEFEKNTKCHQ